MYADEYPAETEMKRAEDERVDLMRAFIDLTEAIEQGRVRAIEVEKHLDDMTRQREQLRRKLDSVINGDQAKAAAEVSYR